jgi:hypothetical protein
VKKNSIFLILLFACSTIKPVIQIYLKDIINRSSRSITFGNTTLLAHSIYHEAASLIEDGNSQSPPIGYLVFFIENTKQKFNLSLLSEETSQGIQVSYEIKSKRNVTSPSGSPFVLGEYKTEDICAINPVTEDAIISCDIIFNDVNNGKAVDLKVVEHSI